MDFPGSCEHLLPPSNYFTPNAAAPEQLYVPNSVPLSLSFPPALAPGSWPHAPPFAGMPCGPPFMPPPHPPVPLPGVSGPNPTIPCQPHYLNTPPAGEQVQAQQAPAALSSGYSALYPWLGPGKSRETAGCTGGAAAAAKAPAAGPSPEKQKSWQQPQEQLPQRKGTKGRGRGTKQRQVPVSDAEPTQIVRSGSESSAAKSPIEAAGDSSGNTTVMLRNIPKSFTQYQVLELVDQNGFQGRYDFVYMPMDFRNAVNLGYGFVNLQTHQDALALMECFNAFRWKDDEPCEVSWAHPIQGFAQHVERYRNSPVMHPDTPEDFKPMIFRNGLRVPFPPPTKAIRPAKMSKRGPA